MEHERWQRLQRLFEQALERPTDDRDAFVRASCEGDDELRNQLQRLLERADGDDADLRDVIGQAAESALGRHVDGQVGRRFGSWRIVQHLADGGMGSVYLAARADGQYEQQAAVKLLNAGRISEAARARFQAERQILARLDHPHIARLLDGGTDNEGLPYLVMEYVNGEPIDRWCVEHAPDTASRLRLMAQVCRAVQFAHRSLVVHRDLKPSNILIDQQGQPRLLDFGIAKLIEPGADVTGTGESPMTPSHASPEQLSGGEVTTATDIYALGVLMFQLLAGRLPHGDATTPGAELARRIVHTEPPRPSQAVTEGSGARLAETRRHGDRLTPQRLARELAGDLDNIVLMALRKEPERRYPSALALAEDIDRHLAHLPVRARPDTVAYRTAKFARRHPVAVPMTALVTAAALAAAAVFTWRLAAERDRAVAAEARARNAAQFSASVLRRTSADEGGTREVPVRELLARAARRVDSELAGEPAVATRMRLAIGSAQYSWGDYELALAQLKQALTTARQRGEEAGHEVAEILSLIGNVTHDMGQLEASLDWTRQAEAAWQRSGSPAEQAQAISELAVALNALRRRGEAEQAFRDALARMRKVHPGDHDDIAWLLNNLAWNVQTQGRLDEALPMYEEALAMQRRIGTPPTTIGQTLSNLGGVHFDAGDLDTARRLWTETLALFEGIFGADGHAAVARSYNLLARVAIARGETDDALRMSDRALQTNLRLLGENHRWTAFTMETHADALIVAGRPAEAAAWLRRAQEVRQRVLPEGDAGHAEPHLGLGRVALMQGRMADAERELRQALAVIDATRDADRVPLAQVTLALGEAVAAQGRRAEALTLLQRGRAWLQQHGQKAHWRMTQLEALAALPPFVESAKGEGRARAKAARQSLAARLGPNAPAVRSVEAALAR